MLRSPRIRWDSLGVAPPLGDLAEPWSRQAKIMGGLSSWVEDLPRWAEEPGWIPSDADDDERARLEERRGRKGKQAEKLVSREVL